MSNNETDQQERKHAERYALLPEYTRSCIERMQPATCKFLENLSEAEVEALEARIKLWEARSRVSKHYKSLLVLATGAVITLALVLQAAEWVWGKIRVWIG